jgi:flagellar biosynthesis/type III secretory pathway M-ring protein FliF/YscJ
MASDSHPSNVKLHTVSLQADEVANLTRENIKASLDRGERLEIIEIKAENMEKEAQKFKKNATRTKRMFCFQSAKYTILTIIAIAVILIIIIVPIAAKYS